ncbi:transmembrane protein [Cystoisospora suis]|uniref:Transmembrane protein n=1 Tax=Cystoisospora suis TaxID=483139 RepID=A0A2C6KQD8_9APIC|nr:transmembrane protein [Cystoisospora suis]
MQRGEALSFCSTCKDIWRRDRGGAAALSGPLYSSWNFSGNTWGKKEIWRKRGLHFAEKAREEADRTKREIQGGSSIGPRQNIGDLWREEDSLSPDREHVDIVPGRVYGALKNTKGDSGREHKCDVRNATVCRIKRSTSLAEGETRTKQSTTTAYSGRYPLLFHYPVVSSLPISLVSSAPSSDPSADPSSSRSVAQAPSSIAAPSVSTSRLFAYGPKYIYPTQSNRINKKPPPVISSPSAFPAILLTLPPRNITAANPAYVGQHVRLPVLPSADFFSLLTAPRLAAFFPASTRIRNYLRGPHGRIEINQDSQPYFDMLQALAQANKQNGPEVAQEEENGRRSLENNRDKFPSTGFTEMLQSAGIMENDSLNLSQSRAGDALKKAVDDSQERRGKDEATYRTESKGAERRGTQVTTRSSWASLGRGSAAERQAAADYAGLLTFLEQRDSRNHQRDRTGLLVENDTTENDTTDDTSSRWLASTEDGEEGEDVEEDVEVYGDLKDRANEIPQYKVMFDEIAKFSEKKKQMYKGKKPWREDIHPTKGIFDQPGFPGDALPHIRQHNEEMIAQGKFNQVVNEEDLRCDAFWVDDAGKIVKLKANVHISEIRRGPNPAPVALDRARLIAKLPKEEEEWRFVVTTHLGYIEEKKLKIGDVPEMFTPKYMKELWNNHFALPKRGRAPLVLDDGSIVP